MHRVGQGGGVEPDLGGAIDQPVQLGRFHPGGRADQACLHRGQEPSQIDEIGAVHLGNADGRRRRGRCRRGGTGRGGLPGRGGRCGGRDGFGTGVEEFLERIDGRHQHRRLGGGTVLEGGDELGGNRPQEPTETGAGFDHPLGDVAPDHFQHPGRLAHGRKPHDPRRALDRVCVAVERRRLLPVEPVARHRFGTLDQAGRPLFDFIAEDGQEF